MSFLLQRNIWKESAYDNMLNYIAENYNYQEVSVIPFTNEFDDEVYIQPDICLGSTRFIDVCHDADFPVFPSFKPIEKFYPKELWVNGDGYDIAWKDLKVLYPFFIKPYREKFFTSLVVFNQDDLSKIQLMHSPDDANEIIRVSRAIDIVSESRFFIIGGKVITGSQYKLKGILNSRSIDSLHPAWKKAEKILDNHGPICEAFVMDLGKTESGNDDSYKIVELNNLNSSGFYHCEVNKIADALYNLYDPEFDDELQIEEIIPPWYRTSGQLICEKCGKEYYDHPEYEDYKWLNQLCNGDLVKL